MRGDAAIIQNAGICQSERDGGNDGGPQIVAAVERVSR